MWLSQQSQGEGGMRPSRVEALRKRCSPHSSGTRLSSRGGEEWETISLSMQVNVRLRPARVGEPECRSRGARSISSRVRTVRKVPYAASELMPAAEISGIIFADVVQRRLAKRRRRLPCELACLRGWRTPGKSSTLRPKIYAMTRSPSVIVAGNRDILIR